MTDHRTPAAARVVRDYLLEKGLAKSEEEALFHGLQIHERITEEYNKLMAEVYEKYKNTSQ